MSDFQNLFAALAKAQGEMDTLIASSTAAIKSDKGSYSYKYADLADVLKIAIKALSAHGLGIIQVPEVQFEKDGAFVSIGATLFHDSGEFMPIAPLVLRVSGAATSQTIGSAITYARRYQLQSVLGMAADDDDGAAATQSARQPQRQQSPQHRQETPQRGQPQPIPESPPVEPEQDFGMGQPTELPTNSTPTVNEAIRINALEIIESANLKSPGHAQIWAVTNGYRTNEHSARNAWMTMIAGKFGGASIKPPQIKEAIIAYVEMCLLDGKKEPAPA